jgi:hypothetical protein
VEPLKERKRSAAAASACANVSLFFCKFLLGAEGEGMAWRGSLYLLSELKISV